MADDKTRRPGTGSHIPLVEPASESELRDIAETLKLGINDEELKEYTEWLNMSLARCDTLREIPETTIPVLYPRTPGVKPTREDNPLNAWARKVTIKGESSGLLAGKKIAIKDNIYVAGVPLQNGSKIWDGYTPEFDATVVTRILKAGGTITGKSTCENMCQSAGSFTSADGPVLNPHDKTRQTGGSSSGSAALIVAGEVDMALGGDQGGSVRVPSSWTGCVGLKPTWGLVPVTGSIGLEPTVDHIGPMANTVSDVALLLEVIAGYDEGRDHRQIPNQHIPKYTRMLKGDLSGKKFAYVPEGFSNATPGVKSTIDGVVEQIRAAGGVVEVISIPEHKTGGPIFMALWTGFYDSIFRNHGQSPGYNEFYNRSAGIHLKKALETHSYDLQPIMKAVALFGEYVNRKDHGGLLAMAMNQRPWLRAAYDRALEKYDGLIMPTVKFVAREVPPTNQGFITFIAEALKNTVNTGISNLTGHPAISLNVGKALPEHDQAGAVPLPVGLQIIGSHFGEAKLLDLAYGIEKLVQGS